MLDMWFYFAVSATLAWCGLKLALRFCPRLLLDHPNARSLHATAKPRIGGAFCWFAIGVTWFLFDKPEVGIQLALPVALLLGVSLLDDCWHMPVTLRLATHFLAAATFVALTLHTTRLSEAGVYEVVPVWILFIALTIVVVWSANLFNFMDGADGLAGGMAVIGFLALGLGAASGPMANTGIATLAFLIAGASTGFLLLNFQPAQVFLGDAGSVPAGFAAAALSTQGAVLGIWPAWFGLVVFSPFVVDATVTLAKRAAAGKSLMEAHREHYYQRLILAGWSHRKTCIAYYFMMLVSAICALFAKNLPQPWTLLVSLVLTYAALIGLLEWNFRQEKQSGQKSGAG
jgi:UDP-N-acetylmuramyl pentapeptide phosphotransferase/UDP-N-acetylglucosamine-1-phosphate transferase